MDNTQKKKEGIATRLALARKQAKMLDLHRPSISEAEAGRRNVTATELASLAEIYGVELGWLAGSDTNTTDESRDRIQLAARELSKLKTEDLERVLGLLSALKKA